MHDDILSSKPNSTLKRRGTDVSLETQCQDLKQYLRPGEKIIFFRELQTPALEKLLDYKKELAKLCNVDSPADIGENGPALAAKSVSKEEGQGLFECRFGRDLLIASSLLFPEFPKLARTTLLDCASLMGMIENINREEELGRMFHEARDADDPIAKELTERRGWAWPFYGTVDATPLFIIALCRYAKESQEGLAFLKEKYAGRDGLEHTMADALRLSLMWLVRRLNSNAERFLEYRHAFSGSHLNQCLEDSWDSHFYEDGRLPDFNQGIASTEVQGLAYDALLSASGAKTVFSENERRYFALLAGKLRQSVFKFLWIEGESEKPGYFAVGSGRDEFGRVRPMKILKAIPFAILDSKLFDRDAKGAKHIAEQCAKSVFSPKMLGAAGVRSLAAGQPRYMPGSYHNGSVWPIENYFIAKGLERQGYLALAGEIYKRIATAIEDARLYPEFFRGDEDAVRLNKRIVKTWDAIDLQENCREQPPQQIQLWTLAAYAAISFAKGRNKQIRPSLFEEKMLENVC